MSIAKTRPGLPDHVPVYVAATPIEEAVLLRRGVPRRRIFTLADARAWVALADGGSVPEERPAGARDRTGV